MEGLSKRSFSYMYIQLDLMYSRSTYAQITPFRNCAEHIYTTLTQGKARHAPPPGANASTEFINKIKKRLRVTRVRPGWGMT